jgi:hypothetical protein
MQSILPPSAAFCGHQVQSMLPPSAITKGVQNLIHAVGLDDVRCELRGSKVRLAATRELAPVGSNRNAE